MPYVHQRAYDLFQKGLSPQDIYKYHKRELLTSTGDYPSPRTLRRWMKYYNDGVADPGFPDESAINEGYTTAEGQEFAKRSTSDGVEISVVSDQICSLSQLLRAMEVDITEWEIVGYEITAWSSSRKETQRDLQFVDGKISGYLKDTGKMYVQPLFRSWVRLAPRKKVPWEKALTEVIEEFGRTFELPDLPPPLYMEGDYLCMLSLADTHFNKRPLDSAYTLTDAVEEFKRVVDVAVGRIQAVNYPIEYILFPAGNDFLHADNLQGTTTRGTPLEIQVDMREAVRASVEAYIYAIIQVALLVEHVVVMMIEGNHDRYSVIWLGMVLQQAFKDDPRVTIVIPEGPTAYYRYGKTLLGMNHGDTYKSSKLLGIMTSEARQDWGETLYHDWIKWHKHGEEVIQEEFGLVVRTLPALCQTDRWHYSNGYIGNRRAAELLFYHKEGGYRGNMIIDVDDVNRIFNAS